MNNSIGINNFFLKSGKYVLTVTSYCSRSTHKVTSSRHSIKKEDKGKQYQNY